MINLESKNGILFLLFEDFLSLKYSKNYPVKDTFFYLNVLYLSYCENYKHYFLN